MANAKQLIVLTGATGYVGGRLLKALEREGYRIRCLARRPEFLSPHVGASTEVVRADVMEGSSLREALRGAHTAYYLIHAMGAGKDFERADRTMAEAFGLAAHDAGISRIVYLGGLGHGANLSRHLASRQEVGSILRESGVPTLEFRASVIIGSGSLSFEMVRALVEKLPVMVTPRWVKTPTQPIAIEDVISYLVAALDVDVHRSAVIEIGGADLVSYLGVMKEYARQRKLRRLMIPVPVLTPRLSSMWLGLVTPVFARIGRELIDGVRNPTTVRDSAALRLFRIRPRGLREAVERALQNEDQEFAETRWSDALSSSGRVPSWGGKRIGTRIVDSRSVSLKCSSREAFSTVERIGGLTGWYFADWMWKLRGFIDLLAGGVGLRRGRPHPERLITGDTVDFWRVEACEPDRLLRLVAEMKLPGRAWLQFEVEGGAFGSTLRQSAIFDPIGLFGLLYWYALYPAHAIVFAGMLHAIAKTANAGGRSPSV
jgi:uncharacterized protein YbjT (DUF2867 family)